MFEIDFYVLKETSKGKGEKCFSDVRYKHCLKYIYKYDKI